ncbi:thiamine-phosphate kinase [Balneicella halophila]|nr:thiamine-phosphate kinase [Balneicella halophila]
MQETPIEKLGEFALINEITKNIQIQNTSTLKGVGDDAAVLSFSEKVVTTTDMLLEGIHFDLMYTPLKHLGYKAVAINVSDILAMNATPSQILLSIAVDKRFTVEMIEDFMEGVHYACEKYRVDLVGGDTTSSLTGFAISVTAIGEATEEELCYRDGAKPNELICVSGDLGASYLGLQLLEREKALFEKEGVQPDLAGHDYILERQLKPEARQDIIALLKKLKLKPTSMIDISDGLASDILQICKTSKVGCLLYEDKIPIDYTAYNMAEELNINATTCALNGGEDYELLFTLPLDAHDIIEKTPEIQTIGYITEETKGHILQTRGGAEVELKAQGWK